MTPSWLALRLPLFALDAVARGRAQSTRPLAVIDPQPAIPRVLVADRAATRAGVRPGQSAQAARALCPTLDCVPRELDAERTLRELLGLWAYQYSDAVSLALPDAVVLEIGASLKLLGGWRKIEQRMRDELGALPVNASLAVAPTPRAAWVLAGVENGLVLDQPESFQRALAQLPLRALAFEPRTLEALHGMGFRRLHDLRVLPRAALARRVGPAVIDALDRLYGEAPDSLARYRPPPRFETQLHFDGRVESVEGLRFPLRRLLDDLAQVLQHRDGGVDAFELTLDHEGSASTCVRIGLGEPERDAGRLFGIACLRLERVSLVAPVVGLKLSAEALPPFVAPNRDLFERARQGALDWTTLLERMRARLGDDAVLALDTVADHRPQRAQRRRAFAAQTTRAGSAGAGQRAIRGASSTAPGQAGFTQTALPAAPRPLWLLERPIPLRTAPLELLSGPERIESGWWDGADLRRDFYLARLADGAHAWISAVAGERDAFMLEGFAG